MNFGPPEYTVSKKYSNHVRYRLRSTPGYSHLFYMKRKRKPAEDGSIKSVWHCVNCCTCCLNEDQKGSGYVRSREARLILVTSPDGYETIITDPELGHHQECQLSKDVDVDVFDIQQKIILKIKEGKIHPEEAFKEMCEILSSFQKKGCQTTKLLPMDSLLKTLYRLWNTNSETSSNTTANLTLVADSHRPLDSSIPVVANLHSPRNSSVLGIPDLHLPTDFSIPEMNNFHPFPGSSTQDIFYLNPPVGCTLPEVNYSQLSPVHDHYFHSNPIVEDYQSQPPSNLHIPQVSYPIPGSNTPGDANSIFQTFEPQDHQNSPHWPIPHQTFRHRFQDARRPSP